MKYNRIILSAVIALVMMLALPLSGETDALQYTADPTNAEKLAKLRFESIGHF